MKKQFVCTLFSISLLAHLGCGNDEISHEDTVGLCENVVDHTQPCCSLTSEQVGVAKEACSANSFSDGQVQLMECTIAASCDALLNNGACGGLTCNN